MIWSLLKHRAAVTRPTRTQNPTNGQWVTTYALVTESVRCMYVPQGWQENQDRTVDSQSESTGSVFFAAGTDVRPGDRLTIKGHPVLTVGSRGGGQDDAQGHAHHIAYEVTQ